MEIWKQGSGRLIVIFFALLAATAVSTVMPGEEEGGSGWNERTPFLLRKSEVVVKTEGGEIRVFRGQPWNGHPARMHIGLVTMEPNTLLIPQYIDADLIFVIRKGEAKIGWIHKDELVERQLKTGDLLRIPAGSTFYGVNTGQDQQLQVIASIVPVGTDLIADFFTAFYIGGGVYPPSVFAGFDIRTLTSAFNASPEEVRLLTSDRTNGPIIFITEDEGNHLRQLTGTVNSAMEKLKQSRRLAQDDDEKTEMEAKEENRKGACRWKSTLSSIFFREAPAENSKVRHQLGDPVKAPDAYHIYDRDPDYRNDYGWTIEVNQDDYLPLKKSDISVFLVNISAGSMMAPHVNPRATEYGIVIAGAGTVEVVHPNGTAAMKAKVKEGDVYWVPRFYPFVQVAEGDQPLEILGFTTSARRNRAQFLAGKSSLLRVLLGKELAAGFGVREEELRQLVTKQTESVIFPRWAETAERE